MRRRTKEKNHRQQSSQHVVAAIECLSDNDDIQSHGTFAQTTQKGFENTSGADCYYWTSTEEDVVVLLGANCPDAIVETEHWVGVVGGLPYYSTGDDAQATPHLMNDVIAVAESIICDSNSTSVTAKSVKDISIVEGVGQWLSSRTIAGYWVVILCHKESNQLFAWNDPFGFMPVFFNKHYTVPKQDDTQNVKAVAFSSYWDCLVVPHAKESLQKQHQPLLEELIDWNVVAEYILLGTTVSNGTFGRNVSNMEPGAAVSMVCSTDGQKNAIRLQQSRYTTSYGACEMIDGDDCDVSNYGGSQQENHGTRKQFFKIQKKGHNFYCEGIEVEPPNKQRRRLVKHVSESSSQSNETDRGDVWRAQRYFEQSLHVADAQCSLEGAALTGGGDTRLVLTSMTPELRQRLVFQTHDKQSTDLRIARLLSETYCLQHKQIPPTLDREAHCDMLHDRLPLIGQPTSTRSCASWPRKTQENDFVRYKIHGRFGTEFMGFLCFDKTSLHFSETKAIDSRRLTQLYSCIFNEEAYADLNGAKGDGFEACHPLSVLVKKFTELTQTKERLGSMGIEFDPGYALQIQLFTRAFFCDIYGGLREGSWFSMPFAFFVRNNFSPFLDSRLLRLLLCHVPAEEKRLPNFYKWYGSLYTECVSETARRIPCNNRLLCMHTNIPRAVKQPEQQEEEYKPFKKTDHRQSSNEFIVARVEKLFQSSFWDGAVLIAAMTRPTPETIAGDIRPAVRLLVENVGPENAVALSLRLGNFLLFLEERLQ